MASLAQWVDGARPRTLFLAVAPVVAGTGAAGHDGSIVWTRAVLALVVALALQVGVNYANDYSDGLRGTDAERVGPVRLVGSGAASPAAVRAGAFGCFGVAAAAGIALAAAAGWWLLLVGAASILAAWFYTGGRRPYGYAGVGELAVFVFFGLVAVCGTDYVQTATISTATLLTAIPVGLLACAVLMANNVRDIPGDTVAGKRTLAVRLGDRFARYLFAVLVIAAPLFAAPVAWATHSGPPLLGLAAGVLVPAVVTPVLSGAQGARLIPTLRHTGQLTLLFAIMIAVGLVLA